MRGVGTWRLLLNMRDVIDGFTLKLPRFWDEGGVCRHDQEAQARLGDGGVGLSGVLLGARPIAFLVQASARNLGERGDAMMQFLGYELFANV
jgi:hypothetical protein